MNIYKHHNNICLDNRFPHMPACCCINIYIQVYSTVLALWLSVNILNTSIMSPLILLYFKVGSFSSVKSLPVAFFSQSRYHFSCHHLYTRSMSFISPLWGFHTALAYSRCDLTIVLYNIKNCLQLSTMSWKDMPLRHMAGISFSLEVHTASGFKRYQTYHWQFQ